MNERRSYPIFIVFNGRVFNEVQISAHYEIRHGYMNDELILEIVKKLNREIKIPQARKGEYEYFEFHHFEHKGKRYRLILCIEEKRNAIGVINCFRS